MKKQTSINEETIKLLYKGYKDYIIPVAVIIVCVLLFFMVIVPQINGLLELQKQLKSEQVKLATLQKNLTALTNLDASILNSQYEISSSTLPVGKDFAGVINAVSIAAGKTGLAVGDYGFKVGEITKLQTDVTKFPFLQLSVNLLGDITGGSKFIAELQKIAPISEVISLSSSFNSISVTINFYYKTIPPINFNEEIPLQTLSAKNQAVLDKISSWSNVLADAPVIPSTTSGRVNPMPF